MPAATLKQAAGQCTTHMTTRWIAGTLKANLLAFVNGFTAQFSEQMKFDHPILNWSAVILALDSELVAGGPAVIDYTQFNNACQYVYRLCWLAQILLDQGKITGPQGAAILAAYNANIN